MFRPLHTWVLFGLCLVLAAAAMGWVSWKTLQLEAAEAAARGQAAREENVRLALWRMDSRLAPLIAQESARPYFVYRAFYPAERAYARMYAAEPQAGETLVASPLLTLHVPEVQMHFQIGPDGSFTSPQVPQYVSSAPAKEVPLPAEHMQATKQLASLRERLGRDLLLASLPAPSTTAAVSARQLAGNGPRPELEPPESDVPSLGPLLAHQQSKSSREFSRRAQYNRNAQQVAMDNNLNWTPPPGSQPAAAISEGAMKPLWTAGLLVLARRVSVNGGEYIQGCVLNWTLIRPSLLADIADLLPQAALEPAPAEEPDRAMHMLAAIPAQLLPGPIPNEAISPVTPIRLSLAIAWTCVLLAAAAVGVLLVGAVTLSERRGAFVSAVTHELRTPLTTLRMYTEMLAEGMVREEDKRRSYLQTMRAEADRLGHLVENVLAYSRLERGRARSDVVTIAAGELIERVRQRLTERAEQAGMQLVVEPAENDQTAVRADPSAVEQILFNLVDNACKYAAPAADRSIHLDTQQQSGAALIRVRDHGPGIEPADRRRLFHPFCKSARQAANSAPGVGLGLALSRRLAREMGGDLYLSRDAQAGASFVLSLPTA